MSRPVLPESRTLFLEASDGNDRQIQILRHPVDNHRAAEGAWKDLETVMRCPRCGGKVIRDDDLLTRQREHSCIVCGWNDSRPLMSADQAAMETRNADRGYHIRPWQVDDAERPSGR